MVRLPKAICGPCRMQSLHSNPAGSGNLDQHPRLACNERRAQPCRKLDDCLYALEPTLPHLTRFSLHRCLQRHGISLLPEVQSDKPVKRRFKNYPMGYFHVDSAEVQTSEGKPRQCPIRTMLTNNGIQFMNRACDRYAGDLIFSHVCNEHGIEYCLTKIKHPWTNRQVSE